MEEMNLIRKAKIKLKKIMSYMLAVTMIAGSISLSPLATVEVQAAVETRNVNLRLSDNSIAGIEDPTVGNNSTTAWSGSKVYYANTLYRVLDAKGILGGYSSLDGSMLLLADNEVGPKKWFDDGTSRNPSDPWKSDWSTSSIRTYLNGIGNDQFLNSFSTIERNAIKETSISKKDGDSGNTTDSYNMGFPSTPTNDKVFLLDLNDISYGKYGFQTTITPNNSRKIEAYTKWWLRSPGSASDYATLIGEDGDVGQTYYVRGTENSIRPALNLVLSSVLFSSASGLSKSDYLAETTGASATGTPWVLTLTGGTDFTAARVAGETGSVKVGDTMHVNVSNVGTVTEGSGISYTQLSAMLVDSDETVAAYGQIKDSAVSDSNLGVTIPVGITDGDYTLKVFAEQVHTGNATDYASNMADIPITVANPKTYNTPTSSAREGISTTVVYTPASPQIQGTHVTATVTLSGTATVAGTHEIELSSGTVAITPPAVKTKHVNTRDSLTDSFVFSFDVGSSNISDIVLIHTFVADDSTITVNPAAKNFGTKTVGYTRPEAQTFTITNIGNTDITAYDVTVSGSDYDVVYTSGTIAKNNGTATFTVQPKTGLSVGNHAADITITTTPAQTSAVVVPVSFTVTSTPSPSPTPNPNENKRDDNNKEESSPKKNEDTYVNPLSWTFAGSQSGSLCTIEQQGPACKAAFAAATPAGYREAFSFNLSTRENGAFTTTASRKTGKFTLNIPKEYQKPGRIFMLVGMGKDGKIKTYTDEDLSDGSITITLDLEGYAFSLIYTDEVVSTTSTAGQGSKGENVYIVQKGDVLSRIAKNLGVSRSYLTNKNNLTNPNQIKIGQKLYY